jgi:hypothetical protein
MGRLGVRNFWVAKDVHDIIESAEVAEPTRKGESPPLPTAN